MENQKTAVRWYIQALGYNIDCVEAFEKLVDNKMLTVSKEEFMVSKYLNFSRCPEWLKLFFETKLSIKQKSCPSKVLQPFQKSADFINCKAKVLLSQYKYNECADLLEKSIEEDVGLNSKTSRLYSIALYALKDNLRLFLFAHRLVENHPLKTVGWFSAGLYYLLIDKNEAAKKFFVFLCKAFQQKFSYKYSN
ncbi:hypothetical protein MHBO_004584 [Bonamia ostreae]|uniref:Uncharacterized protein n=1 Tax=Bonamia ostreae TaxID=126728 RepID=A0ABV2AUF0_9EUKA